jgi:hypothetical protein
MKRATQVERKTLRSRELLRRSYRPKRVRVLFVGEAPPASGRFFYQEDSGLFRAIRHAFVGAFPRLREPDFLESFCALHCYLVDLCEIPVDRLSSRQRIRARRDSEARFAKSLKQLRPEIIVTVVRGIAENVERSQGLANWSGLHIKLPYPGRWHHHRNAFVQTLIPVLRKNLDELGH